MFQHLSAFRFNPVQLTWGATLFFTVSNIVLWQTLWANVDINSLHNVLFFISLPISLFCFVSLLLTPLMILPYLRKPVLFFLFVISAGCSYFMLRYNVLINRNTVQNFFETHQAKITSYLSLPLVLTVIFLGVLPGAVMVFLPTKKIGRYSQTLFWWMSHIVGMLTVMAAVLLPLYKDYASLLRNNMQIEDQVLPYNMVNSTAGYLKRKFRAKSKQLRIVAKDATRIMITTRTKPQRIFVVTSEVARATNFQLEGYSCPAHSISFRAAGFYQFQTCFIPRQNHGHFAAADIFASPIHHEGL